MDRIINSSKINRLQLIYERLLLWSAHKHALYYLGGLTIAEAVFFPIPPDVMLVPMVIAKKNSAWRLALYTTIFSVIGGVIGYFIGYFIIDTLGTVLIKKAALEKVNRWFDQYGIYTILAAGVTPIPYKIFTFAAGAAHMALLPFIAASLVGRGGRFFLVALFARYLEKALYFPKKILLGLGIILMLMTLGCVSKELAPVETRHLGPITNGVHIVNKGDTIYSIAWRYERDYQDLAGINNIKSPYRLKVGQKITLGKTKVLVTDNVNKKEAKKIVSVKAKPTMAEKKVEHSNKSTLTKWVWPNQGQIVNKFSNEGKINKGIDITNQFRSPIVAALDGIVVYAGNGLRGYGNLIIIKHNDSYLSAYAFNDEIIVEESQLVKRGEKIAYMGYSNNKQPLLHFEIRYNGKPIDPLTQLPNLNKNG